MLNAGEKKTMSKTTEHATQAGEILFMAASRPLLNNKNGKTEFSIKVKLNKTDPAVAHLTEVANYKVDTKTNRTSKDKDTLIVNFTSEFAPLVSDTSGQLEGQEIPFFDGRKDTGTAIVAYKVIDFGDNQIVRLSGIKLLNLNLAPRENKGSSTELTLELLKKIG